MLNADQYRSKLHLAIPMPINHIDQSFPEF